jgi:hypothetical protein
MAWLLNGDQMPCSACQLGPSASYWFQRCTRWQGTRRPLHQNDCEKQKELYTW